MKRKVSNYYFSIVLTGLAQLLFVSYDSLGQRLNLSYKVMQNNNTLGWIKIQKTETGTSSHIILDSEIKKKLIFTISVVEKQEATFTNGLMMKSFIYRKVNNDVKMNKNTLYNGKFYDVRNLGKSERLMISRIHYNLLSLYFKEPVNVKQVYSDTFQQLLNIEFAGNACYKVKLPDGNSNYYYYANGICSRVRLEHTLFSIEFVRN
ncbi:MAG TPA: DUF6134 family protein [Chitinophagaceae bacterium]|jgi:hypothetical protein|nr:DUF6134 family protein [Chitinophagaceae bacterium]